MGTKEREKFSLCELCISVRIFLYLFIFILLTFFLHAQDIDTSRNIVVKTSEGLEIHQVISFPAHENILRYEIEIEERRQNSWVLVRKLETEINSFEVSLNAGHYRYKYTAYNIMNLFWGQSDWQEFSLVPAIAPTLERYRPFYGMYYKMSEFQNTLTIYGNNISDKTEFALIKRNKRNFDWSGVSLHGQKGVIIPESVTVNDNQVQLFFSRESLKRGVYQIFERNPGGLWVSFGEVRVGFHSNNDFLFEYGYSPVINDNGFNNNQYLRIGWFPVKTKIGNFGLGGQLLGGYKSSEDNDMFISLNLLYQYTATERLSHNARVGIMPLGVGYWENDEWETDPETGEYILIKPGYDINETYLYINLGYSLQYYFWKNFYATAGVDFLYALTDHGIKSKFYINPFIGLGFQVGRWGEYAQVSEGLKRGEDYSVPVMGIPKGEHILSFGWLPMIPIYGIDLYGDRLVRDRINWAPEYNEKGYKFLNSLNPIGFNINYAYLPYIYGNNKFGYEFEFSYLYYDNSHLNDIDAPIDSLLFGIRYQRILNDSWFFNTRVSFGIAKVYNFFEEYKIYEESGVTMEDEFVKGGDIGFALAARASIQYFFWKNMFAQSSADVMFVFGNKLNIQFRPGISLGWQYNRGAETGLQLPGNGFPQFRN